MHDRIGAVGGTLTIDTAPGHGTTIHAHIPPTVARNTPTTTRVVRRSSGATVRCRIVG